MDGWHAWQVRARGANKGNFVHMVLARLAWPVEGAASAPADADADADGQSDTDDYHDRGVAAAAAPGGRFCLCVGDDVSDEDMFIAAKVSLRFPKGLGGRYLGVQ